MAGPELSILLTLKDSASKQLEAVNKQITANAANIRGLAIGLGAYAAASMLFFGKAVKAAAEEEAGIIRLSAALNNVGVSYDQVRSSLEKTIDATMRKTSVSDDEQRAALATLILMTGKYEGSLEMLNMAIDLSAGMGMDLSSATRYIGMAFEGNYEMLGRYIPALRKATSTTEALGIISKATAGHGEKLGKSMQGSLKIIRIEIDNLMESIGDELMPAVKELTKLLQTMLDFFKAIPAPLKSAFVYLAAIAGAMASIIAPALLTVMALGKLALLVPAIAGIAAALSGVLLPIALIAAGIVGVIGLAALLNKIFTPTPAVAMAGGGIVTRPTLAMLGERGPEAVVPLGHGVGGVTVNISSNAFMGSESEARTWARKIGEYLRETNRTTSYGRLA